MNNKNKIVAILCLIKWPYITGDCINDKNSRENIDINNLLEIFKLKLLVKLLYSLNSGIYSIKKK
jgi:hypothetical protein